MIDHRPRVSIGLPVFNGERFLEEALTSILAQTFTDFELVISDNASTDKTSELCTDYRARDARIRYHRNETNIGGANNHNLTFHMSRGEYFRWAAYDDVCAPELIEKCVEALDNDPLIVLSYGQTIAIDEHGEVIGRTSLRLGESDTPHERLLELADPGHFNEVVYGLIRSDAIRSTRLLQNYTGSDRTLLCELGLQRKFHLIPEPLFYKRHHPRNAYPDYRTRMAWFDKGYVGKIVLPNWMQIIDLVTTIHRVQLTHKEKMLCYLNVVGPVSLRNRLELYRDLKFAAHMALHSAAWRTERYAGTMNW